MRGGLYYATFVACLITAPVFARPQSQWEVVAKSRGSDIVRAAVAFQQPKLAEAESLLMAISDPTSDKFGQYLDHKQVVGSVTRFQSHSPSDIKLL